MASMPACTGCLVVKLIIVSSIVIKARGVHRAARNAGLGAGAVRQAGRAAAQAAAVVSAVVAAHAKQPLKLALQHILQEGGGAAVKAEGVPTLPSRGRWGRPSDRPHSARPTPQAAP